MFEEIEEQILSFRAERDWQQFHTPRSLAASLVIEAAELLELFQWARDDEVAEIVERKSEEIREELADICIYLALISHDLDIDQKQAVEEKLELNRAKYPVERARGSFMKYVEYGEQR